MMSRESSLLAAVKVASLAQQVRVSNRDAPAAQLDTERDSPKAIGSNRVGPPLQDLA